MSIQAAPLKSIPEGQEFVFVPDPTNPKRFLQAEVDGDWHQKVPGRVQEMLDRGLMFATKEDALEASEAMCAAIGASMKTPVELAGYAAGDRFTLQEDLNQGNPFSGQKTWAVAGTEVELYEDDGTDKPYFRLIGDPEEAGCEFDPDEETGYYIAGFELAKVKPKEAA